MTTVDTLNGAKIIIQEMEAELDNKKLSRRDGMYIRANIYQLTVLSSLMGEIEEIKKHDLIGWAMKHPKLSIFISIGTFILIQTIDWISMTRPLLSAVLKHYADIDLPIKIP